MIAVALVGMCAPRQAVAQGLIGGNGVCPFQIGPDAMVGAYSPVDGAASNTDIQSLAQMAAGTYYDNTTDQSYPDKIIFGICQPTRDQIVNSVQVIAACSQVVAGTNYAIEFSITVPCDGNDGKLTSGTNLTRTMKAVVYQPLDGEAEVQSVEDTTDDSYDLCATNGAPGSFSPVENPESNKEAEDAAKFAARSYYYRGKTGAIEEAFKVCKPNVKSFENSVKVSDACTQVVSGTNVRVTFTATIPCSEENAKKLPEGFTLKQGFVTEVNTPTEGDEKVDFVVNTGNLLGVGGEQPSTTPAPGPESGSDSAPGPESSPWGGLVGGNGVCSFPNPTDPVVGAYSPVDGAASNTDIQSLAQMAAGTYYANTTDQSYPDKIIFGICQPTRDQIVNSVQVIAACSQVVAGTNYAIEFNITVPCATDKEQLLTPGTSLDRTFLATVYVPLNNGTPQVQSVEAEDNTYELCIKPQKGMSGAFSPVSNPSMDDMVQQAAIEAAQAYFNDPSKSGDLAKAFNVCNPSADAFSNSVKISDACTQVVAGTNVKVRFTAMIPCSDTNAQNLPEGFPLLQGFDAEVFIPLPSSNEVPNVTYVIPTGGLLLVGDSTGPSPAPPNYLCPASQNGGAGGYTPVQDPANDAGAQDAAIVSASYYYNESMNGNTTMSPVFETCQPAETDFVNSVEVTNACSQVVAGTNYLVTFTATVPCSDQDIAKLPPNTNLNLEFEAKVYVPLPSSGEGPQVVSVNETSMSALSSSSMASMI